MVPPAKIKEKSHGKSILGFGNGKIAVGLHPRKRS